ncbi:MAG: hypothetical protein WCQ60_04180 [bacterium]
MKTIITIAVVLYIIGTAVQFSHHDITGIVCFVGAGGLVAGIFAGRWAARVEAREHQQLFNKKS